jgi:hypothetical protein
MNNFAQRFTSLLSSCPWLLTEGLVVRVLPEEPNHPLERKRFRQLLGGPLRCWMRGYVGVDNATAVPGQHQEYLLHLEPNGRHGKEIHRNQALEVIVEERAPSL